MKHPSLSERGCNKVPPSLRPCPLLHSRFGSNEIVSVKLLVTLITTSAPSCVKIEHWPDQGKCCEKTYCTPTESTTCSYPEHKSPAYKR